MVVIAGDGLLREAFRSAPEDGDAGLLAESETMLDAYVGARLGRRSARRPRTGRLTWQRGRAVSRGK